MGSSNGESQAFSRSLQHDVPVAGWGHGPPDERHGVGGPGRRDRVSGGTGQARSGGGQDPREAGAAGAEDRGGGRHQAGQDAAIAAEGRKARDGRRAGVESEGRGADGVRPPAPAARAVRHRSDASAARETRSGVWHRASRHAVGPTTRLRRSFRVAGSRARSGRATVKASMRSPWLRMVPALVFAGAALHAYPIGAQDSPLGGAWTLNRSLSELPREIGFNAGWFPTSGDAGQSSGSGGSGGRGGRGSGGGGSRGGAVPNTFPPESYEDAQRPKLVTGEARNPPMRLTIVDTPPAVTITNELGQSRTLHPTGRPESVEIQGVSFVAMTKREGDQLVTVYDVEQGRTVRYTYSRSSNPPQLVVEVQFLEKGAGDKARRVYEPGSATTTASSAPEQSSASPPRPPAGVPAQTSEKFDSRPGAELRGL